MQSWLDMGYNLHVEDILHEQLISLRKHSPSASEAVVAVPVLIPITRRNVSPNSIEPYDSFDFDIDECGYPSTGYHHHSHTGPQDPAQCSFGKRRRVIPREEAESLTQWLDNLAQKQDKELLGV
jgi:hypothetical protein